jgi:tripartite-type tricarboxylate transporter receptor subunit TctC
MYRRHFLRLLTGAALIPFAYTAKADSWPDRSVRLVVARSAGSGTDSVGRILAGRLSSLWNQQVIVENQAGPGDWLGLENVAQAAPDGYTLLLAAGPPAIGRFLYATHSFDPAAAFAPVSLVATFPEVIAVSNTAMMRSVADLIAYAQRYPGRITWASPGVGSVAHLAGELFKRMAGIEMKHVPYAGVTEDLMSDLAGGRLNLMFDSSAQLLPPMRSHLLHGLAVTSGRRFEAMPELPTVAESGLPGYDVSSWYGLYVPTGTPPEIVERLNTDIVLMLRETAVKESFEPFGVLAASSSPKQLAQKNADGAALWGPLITAANIKGEE